MTFEFKRRNRNKLHNEGEWKVSKPFSRTHSHEILYPPTQNVTNSLFIAGAKKIDSTHEVDEKLWKSILPGISSVQFGRLSVTELTYGYIIKAKYGKEGPRHWDPKKTKYYGRELITDAFSINVDECVFSEAEKIANEKKYPDYSTVDKLDEQINEARALLRQIVMHTLEHAFLCRLPYIIGLEPTKINGSYDFTELNKPDLNFGARNVIYVYDSEEGGTGACETVFKDEQYFLRWLDSARWTIRDCPSGYCREGACKRCIFIQNCGEVNYRLNRYLAAPVFFKDYEDWVYEND